MVSPLNLMNEFVFHMNLIVYTIAEKHSLKIQYGAQRNKPFYVGLFHNGLVNLRSKL